MKDCAKVLSNIKRLQQIQKELEEVLMADHPTSLGALKRQINAILAEQYSTFGKLAANATE